MRSAHRATGHAPLRHKVTGAAPPRRVAHGSAGLQAGATLVASATNVALSRHEGVDVASRNEMGVGSTQ